MKSIQEIKEEFKRAALKELPALMENYREDQRKGVMNLLEQAGKRLEKLEAEAALGRSYLRGLRREVLRLFCAAEPEADGKIFAAALEKLEEQELLELRRVWRGKGECAAFLPQLPYDKRAELPGDGSAFMI